MRRATHFPPVTAVSVDCVVFGLDEGDLKVLLIRRGIEPFRDRWALPGGFARPDESLDAAASRELREETGLKDIFLEQLYSFGDPGRDPRQRVVTVAYYALVSIAGRKITGDSDARSAAWFPVTGIPPLAFDHDRILGAALTRLRGKIRYQPIGFELLPSKFTLTQLQQLYETILERPLDKRNFRKKILGMNILSDAKRKQKDVAHRAARLYRFNAERYRRLAQRGFHFEI